MEFGDNPLFAVMNKIAQQVFICDALHDLVQFVKFKKCEKHPWKNVTFSKVAD